MFLQTHLVDFADHYAGHLTRTFLALTERVAFLHRNNDLFRHNFVIINSKITTQKISSSLNQFEQKEKTELDSSGEEKDALLK